MPGFVNINPPPVNNDDGYISRDQSDIQLALSLGYVYNYDSGEWVRDVEHGTPFGVLDAYTVQTNNGNQTTINKGQLNKIQLRPQVRSEYVEQASLLQSTITSSNIVGQIFKASEDNINGLELTLQSSGTQTEIDNIQGYANDAALQAVWVETGSAATLESTIVSPNNSSTQSMKMPADNNGDEWVKTISSSDLLDVTFSLDYRQGEDTDKLLVRFFVGDGINTKSIILAVSHKDTWQTFTFSSSALSEDGGGTTNMTAITKIGLRIDDGDEFEFAYADNIIYLPSPGSLEIKLWDMGPSIPVSTTTKISDGTQYTTMGDFGLSVSSLTVNLLPGKRRCIFHDFVAGAGGSNTLTIDNYYIVSLHHIDKDIKVYGSKTAPAVNRYINGYAFTAPNESTAITQIGTYNDLMFSIFSVCPAYITQVQIAMDTVSGPDSTAIILIEGTDDTIKNTISSNFHMHNKGTAVVFDLSHRPALIEKNDKLEIYYNDDSTDSISSVDYDITYLYKPLIING